LAEQRTDNKQIHQLVAAEANLYVEAKMLHASGRISVQASMGSPMLSELIARGRKLSIPVEQRESTCERCPLLPNVNDCQSQVN